MRIFKSLTFLCLVALYSSGAFAVTGFDTLSLSASEGTSAQFSVSSDECDLVDAADCTVTLTFSINGTATSGVDYTAPASNTITLDPTNSWINFVDIQTIDDPFHDPNESLTITLQSCEVNSSIFNAPQSCIITTPNATLDIIDNDPPPVVALDSNAFTVSEGNQVTVTVIRSSNSFGAISVDYATADVSALANQDYTPQSGTLSWADGETASKTITLSTISDLANETDETFTFSLSNPQGSATLGAPSTATITIQNTATPGAIGFTNTAFSVLEGGQVVLSVTRNSGTFGTATVDYTTTDGSAVANQDFTPQSGVLSWAAGESGVKTITVATLLDTQIENLESFTVNLSNPTGNATLLASTASIDITNTTQSLSSIPDLTENQASVAKAVEDACASASGELLTRCNEILNSGLTIPELIEALESINPAQIASQGSVAIDFGFQQLQIIHGRIASLRNKDGKNNFSLSGFTMNSFGQNIPIGRIAESMLYNALNEAAGEEPLRDSPLGFFIKGQISIGDQKGTSRERGFEMDAKNITVGLDYRLTDELVLGIASGYGHTQTDYDNNGGEMQTHSGNFSTYGSYFLPKDFYLDWILSYSINSYESTRGISYTGLSTTAQANPFGDQYGGSLGFGKDFYVKNFFINPYARFEYLRTGVDEYTEQGGGGLALRISEQSMHSIATTVGGQISQSISMPWGILAPGLRFEWRHQFLDDERTLNAQFVNAAAGTGSFSIKTDNPDRDYFNLGASLAVTLPEGRSAFIRYETRLGQNNISDHTVEAAIRIPF